MSCRRLASVNDEGKIREWNRYLEGRASEDINTIVPMGGEAPCSGVVNFKIDPVVAGAWDNLVLQMAASLNKVSRFVLDKSIPLLDNYWCQLGNDGMAKSIRQYANPESTRYWRQYTVRVPQETHGVLIGIGHELRVSTSTISTFAFNKFLAGYRGEGRGRISTFK